MSSGKVTGRTIRILEEEGLADAINEVALVLDGHGFDKHGTRKWMSLEYERLQDKFERHLARPGFDNDSGCLHLAHAGSRLLMMLRTVLHSMEKSDVRAAE